MISTQHIFGGRRWLVLLSVLLATGFFATTVASYFVSKSVIRQAIIGQELPLAASNVYVELQKDLVRPVVIASTMAHDTFLVDWVLKGERDVEEINRYLQKIKTKYGAFSSFFVSERTLNYYTGVGILKKISPTEPRDRWYYRVRDLKDEHEINIDPDMANHDALTIFINYRVLDGSGRYLGATGIGLTMDAMYRRISDYQQRYQRSIYFVDDRGRQVLFGNTPSAGSTDLHDRPGLREIIDRILVDKAGGYQYEAGGSNRLLNVQYIPELKWYLFIEKDESLALADVRRVLYINVGICLIVTLLVVALMNVSLARYQRRIEKMATTDKLTGMLNRQAFSVLVTRLLAQHQRESREVSFLMVDLDRFKEHNDQHGHLAGDRLLCRAAELLQQCLRQSDIAVRWGGDEFLVVLDHCNIKEAWQIGEKIRSLIARAGLPIGGGVVTMTASVGVSQLSGDELPEQTISRADVALYRAKAEGRDRVCAETVEMALA